LGDVYKRQVVILCQN
ncbi:UvrABC system protein A, partial [Haemophilus influenzae]